MNKTTDYRKVLTKEDVEKYQNLQNELMKWASENNIPVKKESSVKENIEKEKVDTRFSILEMHSPVNQRYVWISTEDAWLIEEKRKDGDYDPTVEIWVYTKDEENDDLPDWNDVEWFEMDLQKVTEYIYEFLWNK